VTARALLSRASWLKGFPCQAVAAGERSVKDAHASNHVISLCYVLAHASCPIALAVGDLGAAEGYAETLIDVSTRHSLARSRAFGRGYQGPVAIKRGDVAGGIQLLRRGTWRGRLHLSCIRAAMRGGGSAYPRRANRPGTFCSRERARRRDRGALGRRRTAPPQRRAVVVAGRARPCGDGRGST